MNILLNLLEAKRNEIEERRERTPSREEYAHDTGVIDGLTYVTDLFHVSETYFNELTRLVQLADATPLPCAQCGRAATWAYAYAEINRAPPLSGRWVLHPICAECASITQPLPI